MKTRTKVILCLLLMVFAAASLLSVLAELGVLDRAKVPDGSRDGWELRTWEGRLALFCPPGAEQPQTVTDVYVGGLPVTDRLALDRGVTVPDQESAARLLEDYGA